MERDLFDRTFKDMFETEGIQDNIYDTWRMLFGRQPSFSVLLDKQGAFLTFLAMYFRTLVYKLIVFLVSCHLYIAL